MYMGSWLSQITKATKFLLSILCFHLKDRLLVIKIYLPIKLQWEGIRRGVLGLAHGREEARRGLGCNAKTSQRQREGCRSSHSPQQMLLLLRREGVNVWADGSEKENGEWRWRRGAGQGNEKEKRKGRAFWICRLTLGDLPLFLSSPGSWFLVNP